MINNLSYETICCSHNARVAHDVRGSRDMEGMEQHKAEMQRLQQEMRKDTERFKVKMQEKAEQLRKEAQDGAERLKAEAEKIRKDAERLKAEILKEVM